ncbi:hypothetical protein JX265_003612 [Neoarthrinium moseri]|uniref:Aminoglycoside phosphotransferase domain-containing protein n=1 Tax=Neoarthrinium moseri TaxID=1658444 RepID=A0A9P9WSS4_9PEZI|nr:hypothetical protein JX265_003612 [Neoarthrinium moseri]
MVHQQPATENPSGQDELGGKPVLITSKLLGPPPYVLDPETLADSFNPFPWMIGNSFRQVDENTLVKYGVGVTLVEAEAMDFVSRQTSIKCPQVVGAYELGGTAHILMSFERGKPLEEFWHGASENEKEAVIGQLQHYLNEMRGIKGDYVGGFNRNSCVAGEFEWDFDKTDRKYGPYADEDGFNHGIAEALSRASPKPDVEDPDSPEYNRMYTTQQMVHSLRGHDIVFTHGDLHTGNIIVQDDLTVDEKKKAMSAPAEDKHAISVVLWGGDNPNNPLADPAGHVALAVHADVSQPVICHLHHARCPNQVRFIYETRPSQTFAADPAPRGRCELRGGLSAGDARAANDVLARFGADETQLPFYGEGNCHNWTVAAIGALEDAGLAQRGDAAVWAALIGKGPRAMQRSWVDGNRRRWVDCDEFGQARSGPVDARWSEGSEEKAVASAVTNADTGNLKDRVAKLQKLLGGEHRSLRIAQNGSQLLINDMCP